MVTKYGRKYTGARYRKRKKKKLYERKGKPREVILGETKKRRLRIRGGNTKIILLAANIVNVLDKKNKKTKKVKILNVLEVPSDRFLARKNVLVKGAIIETELGKARITNRPSQESTVQAILLD
jgi:small subunit ribosomal protein S8e